MSFEYIYTYVGDIHLVHYIGEWGFAVGRGAVWIQF
jgi:hypothetical protein